MLQRARRRNRELRNTSWPSSCSQVAGRWWESGFAKITRLAKDPERARRGDGDEEKHIYHGCLKNPDSAFISARVFKKATRDARRNPKQKAAEHMLMRFYMWVPASFLLLLSLSSGNVWLNATITESRGQRKMFCRKSLFSPGRWFHMLKAQCVTFQTGQLAWNGFFFF